MTQSKLLSIGDELENYRLKGLEMIEIDDTEKFTSQVLFLSHKASDERDFFSSRRPVAFKIQT